MSKMDDRAQQGRLAQRLRRHRSFVHPDSLPHRSPGASLGHEVAETAQVEDEPNAVILDRVKAALLAL